MWIADRWKDYEVLDTSNGEKLERWGKYLLVRPDPQVIWNTPRIQEGWRTRNGHYHRSAKGGGEWEFFGLPEEWSISYDMVADNSSTGQCLANRLSEGRSGNRLSDDRTGNRSSDGRSNNRLSDDRTGNRSSDDRSAGLGGADRLTFRLKPFSFKHTGLFPEQAVNWDWFSALIKEERGKTGRPIKVLNLFAYTGGATIAAAAAGASVVHVDAAKGMVTWARENAVASGLGEAPVRWIVDDCMKFVEREIRRGSQYDGIIMDPPSYGRGPKGEVWKLEENIWEFLELTARLLCKKPLFFLLNSYTTGLQPAVLSYMMNSILTKSFGGHVEAEEIGLPVTQSGLILPCGASGRWSR